MKSSEEILNIRNKIAGTLGTNEVQDVLQEFLTTARAELSAYRPNVNDPNSYGVHRALGRVEMLEHLINQGKAAIKATETKGKN